MYLGFVQTSQTANAPDGFQPAPNDSTYAAIMSGGMQGAFDFVPIPGFSLVGGAISNLIASIGAGRKDADVIVPKQNALTDEVLRPYNAALDRGGLSYDQLQQMLAELERRSQEFYAWIKQPALVADGDTRATDQAETWLQKYYGDLKRRLLDALANTPQPSVWSSLLPGGAGGSLSVGSAGNSFSGLTPVLGLLGLLAFFR